MTGHTTLSSSNVEIFSVGKALWLFKALSTPVLHPVQRYDLLKGASPYPTISTQIKYTHAASLKAHNTQILCSISAALSLNTCFVWHKLLG
jgi:hypothetical protein